MKNLDIILDCDGVLANTTKEVLRRYNEEYNLNFNQKDIICWNMMKIQRPGTDMCKYFIQPGFFRHLEVIKDSQKVVSRLIGQENNLFVLTDSPIEGLTDKALWIQENYSEIPLGNIGMFRRKDMVTADVILDDGIHNLKPTRCKYPLLFDAPWNRGSEADEFVRVYSWLDFYNIIQKIRGGYSYQDLLHEREEKKSIEGRQIYA